MAKDLYSELGLSRGASADEIKRAYRSLAGKLHPDRNQDKPDAEERFKRVNWAHQVLGDEKKKRLYDEFGEDGLREGFDPNMARAYGRRGGGGSSFEDIFGGAGGGAAGAGGFGDLFGDLFGGGRRRPRKSPDTESEVSIAFTSAVKGAELELALSGGARNVKVRIPKGADDGDRLRVAGAGSSAAPGMPPGDLLLTLRVKAHPHFERKGLDLTVDLPITLAEAFEGAKIEVPTPTSTVTLKVPPGAQSGQLMRLRGKGVNRAQRTGDLYVRFLIRIPKLDSEPDDETLSLLRELSTPIAEDLRADLSF